MREGQEEKGESERRDDPGDIDRGRVLKTRVERYSYLENNNSALYPAHLGQRNGQMGVQILDKTIAIHTRG